MSAAKRRRFTWQRSRIRRCIVRNIGSDAVKADRIGKCARGQLRPRKADVIEARSKADELRQIRYKVGGRNAEAVLEGVGD